MSNKEEMIKTIFREKPTAMLLNLYNKGKDVSYASNLAKEIDCTYSHCVKVIQKFQKAGYIDFNRSGRIKELSLTKNGKEICENLNKVKNLL